MAELKGVCKSMNGGNICNKNVRAKPKKNKPVETTCPRCNNKVTLYPKK